MATSAVPVSGGSGFNVATNPITEDAETKQLQRVVQNNSSGVELDYGPGTGGAATRRVILDSSQLTTPATAAQAMSSGYAPVGLPTDQPVPNKVQAQANGTSSSRVNSGASTNATSLKTSAGNAFEIDVFNNAAYAVFLKFYNKASARTVGTDTPSWTIPVPAGGGYSRSFRYGKWFNTGIAYAITKLQADSDTTVVAAGDLTGSIDWI